MAMQRVREVYLARLRPDAVETYRRLHERLSPELVAVYHEAGIRDLSCFLSGTWLIIAVERDPEIAGRMAAWLAAHPVEKAWQEQMRALKEEFAPDEPFLEICRLPT